MTAANPFTCGTMLAPGLRPDPFFERAASCCSFANWANLIFFSAFSSSKTAATCWSTNSWPYCPQRVAIPSSWSMHPLAFLSCIMNSTRLKSFLGSNPLWSRRIRWNISRNSSQSTQPSASSSTSHTISAASSRLILHPRNSSSTMTSSTVILPQPDLLIRRKARRRLSSSCASLNSRRSFSRLAFSSSASFFAALLADI
mmetsp:Transcript_28519/g.94726  ORF Transcript_28519/g.94726 Transcript_28519/m.94726 type:complete len:200 (-) Transcript_28519:2-601(-)